VGITRSSSGVAGLLAASLAAAPAAAGPPAGPVDAQAPESTPSIFGGQPAATCEWPTTVSINGSCTGTLVHPEIVVYAAHCGKSPWVWFGESLDDLDAGRFVDTKSCETYPGFKGIGTNTDFAFCRLAEPVTDVEIVPILMGCELELLQPGTEVVAVGFGVDEFQGYGTKRVVSFPIVSVEASGEVTAGGDGLSICNGDSGGPLYLRLPPELDPQRSWRVFGVTSWGPSDCALTQYFGTLHSAVAWIEERTGIDITPCHNSDGSWQAGPDCNGFPLDPGSGNGAWPSWCEGQALGESAATCGQPTLVQDLEPPLVAIVDPLDQTVFTSDPETSTVTIAIEAEASDLGWGLAKVELLINGNPAANGAKSFPPWTWAGAFPPGGYVLSTVATDLAGNSTESAPIHVGVDADPPEPAPEPEPEPEPEPDTGTDDFGETAGGDLALDGHGGCGCTTAPSGAPAGLCGLAIFVVAGRLRRRRK